MSITNPCLAYSCGFTDANARAYLTVENCSLLVLISLNSDDEIAEVRSEARSSSNNERVACEFSQQIIRCMRPARRRGTGEHWANDGSVVLFRRHLSRVWFGSVSSAPVLDYAFGSARIKAKCRSR